MSTRKGHRTAVRVAWRAAQSRGQTQATMRATQTEPERNENQRSIVYNRTWAFFSFIHLSSRVGVSTPERNSRYALRTPRESPARRTRGVTAAARGTEHPASPRDSRSPQLYGRHAQSHTLEKRCRPFCSRLGGRLSFFTIHHLLRRGRRFIGCCGRWLTRRSACLLLHVLFVPLQWSISRR